MTNQDDSFASLTNVSIYCDGVLSGQTSINTEGTWSFDIKTLPAGKHSFTAAVGSNNSNKWIVNVQQTATLPIAPYVSHPLVPLPQNGRQSFMYYDINSDLKIVVPASSLLRGDTVKLYWIGRNTTLGSEIQTVTHPAQPLDFIISRYEVIDVIGYTSTKIRYSIRRNDIDITSRILSLDVTGRTGEPLLEAPSLNGDRNNIRVQRQWLNDDTTVEVRAIGKTTWQSETHIFGTAEYVNIPLDAGWLEANKAASVIFTYSVRIKPSDGSAYRYSQLLRLNPF